MGDQPLPKVKRLPRKSTERFRQYLEGRKPLKSTETIYLKYDTL